MGGGAGTEEEEETAVSCKAKKIAWKKLTCLVVVVVDLPPARDEEQGVTGCWSRAPQGSTDRLEHRAHT